MSTSTSECRAPQVSAITVYFTVFRISAQLTIHTFIANVFFASFPTRSPSVARENQPYVGVERLASDFHVICKGLCDFLLVLSKNTGSISYLSRDTT